MVRQETPVSREPGSPAQPDLKGRPARQGRVRQDRKVRLDLPVTRELTGGPAPLEPLVQRGSEEVRPDPRVLRGPGSRDRRGREHGGLPGYPDQRVLPGRQVRQVWGRQVQPERADLKESPDLREREHKARLVLRVLRDLRGQPDQRVLRETLVLRARQVRQEIQVLRAQRDRQERGPEDRQVRLDRQEPELAVRQD